MTAAKKTTGAVTYTRVSTGEQAEHGTSLDSQREACRAKALALGLPVVAEYEDAGVSGGFLLSRPGILAALAALQAGRADTLICANVSRYSRDVEHQQSLLKSVRAAGGRLVFCDVTFEETPSGDLMFGMMGQFAQWERQEIKRRTVGGRRRNAEQGLQPARTCSPLGYHVVTTADVLRGDRPAGQQGTYQVVEAEAALVRSLFAQYVAGGSLPGLAKRLNADGVPTRRGGQCWRPSAVRCILTNPVYKGVASYGKTHHAQDEARIGKPNPRNGRPLTTPAVVRPADPATVITWPVPALVPEETWDDAQRRLAGNRKLTGGNPRRVRMLAGRALCPHCRSALTVTHHYVGATRANGGTRTPHYVCQQYQQQLMNTGDRACRPTCYPVAAVEEAVVAALLDAVRRPEALAAALAAYAPPAGDTHPRRELAAVDKALSQLRDQEAAAVRAQIAGIQAGASPDAYAAVFADLSARRKDLEDRRGTLSRRLRRPADGAADSTEAAPGPAALTPRLLADTARVLRSPDVPDADKRAILGTVLEAVLPHKTGAGPASQYGARVLFLPGALPAPPPDNPGGTLQPFENDNNKNRRYGEVDERVSKTYAKDSKATNKKALSDPYVKFFRWATDRLGDRDGVVCFVTNNSFADQAAFDGMRKHLLQDFTQVYHLDLHGNVRKNPKLSGTTHNVFGIQVGAGITVAVRKAGAEKFLKYHRVPENWRKTEKLAWLTEKRSITEVPWQTLQPNAKNVWLTEGMQADYETFLPLGTKDDKASKSLDVKAIFKTFSVGIRTNRDDWAFDWQKEKLAAKMARHIDSYNAEVDLWKSAGGKNIDPDAFLKYDDVKIKWSRDLKLDLIRGRYGEFHRDKLREAMYRPFSKRYLFFDRIFNEEVYVFPHIYPTVGTEQENLVICGSGPGNDGFYTIAANRIAELKFSNSTNGGTQCFPFYTYDEDGSNRQDNITNWALGQFRDAYGPDVTKRDIFHYVYALLHHPQYRAKYAENLKRELPRVPLVGTPPARLTPCGNTSPPLHPAAEALRAGARSEEDESAEDKAGLNEAAALADTSSPAGGGGEPQRAGGVPTPRRAGGVPLFRAFADSGARLAALHVGYEDAAEYPLRQVVNKDVPASLRVTKMRLTEGKTAVQVNDSLTLAGVPPETFEYRLGNRSALEWVIDQYQVTTDKRSGLVSDPNRPDDTAYIARLVRKVVTVSLETVQCINALPPLDD